MNQITAEKDDKYLWTKSRMPLVYWMAQQLSRSTDTVAINLPLTWETLCLIDAIREKFRRIVVIPLTSGEYSSLQPGVFPYLEGWQTNYFTEASTQARNEALAMRPSIIVDCLFSLSELGLANSTLPSTTLIIEDTRTGGEKLRSYLVQGRFTNPFFILDDNVVKQRYENRIGIGASIVASILAAGIFLPVKRVAVVGFGPVGQGVAMFASRLGASVAVVEVDQKRQELASDQGYSVIALEQALSVAEVIITATGHQNTINGSHLSRLADGTILVNAGADFGEWNQNYLRTQGIMRPLSNLLTQYTLPSGSKLIEVAGGNSVNLVSGIVFSEFLDITFALAILVMKQQQETPKRSGEIKPDADFWEQYSSRVRNRFPCI